MTDDIFRLFKNPRGPLDILKNIYIFLYPLPLTSNQPHDKCYQELSAQEPRWNHPDHIPLRGPAIAGNVPLR